MRGRQREQPRQQRGREQGREQQGREQGRALPAAVGALCRALPPRSRPAPDTLRRARFDRPQASLDFWRLLYVLLKQIHGGRWTESDVIETQIRFVKSALWYHGYDRPELHQLPADGSAGSRELLLAFSWLLHRLSLLEQLLVRNRVKTGDEASVCTCEDNLPSSQEGTAEAAPEGGLEDRVDVRYLQCLDGRLRFQWRSLHAQHQEQCKLLHKIHLFTSGSHMDKILGHFSVTETDLVRQPENYKQLFQLLESETMQLEAFLEWKQLEPVYWQWMQDSPSQAEELQGRMAEFHIVNTNEKETVLDDMAEEGNMCKSQDARVEKRRLPEVISCCSWAENLTGQMDRLSRDLMALQDQLHQLIIQRKAAWWEKVTAREELQKEGFSTTARKIQESVEQKLRDLTCFHASKKNAMHGSCRLVLRNKHPTTKMGFGQCVSKEAVSAVSATEVIRELQVREASLQRELEQLREECRQRLDEIAQGLEGVICISP